MAGPVRPSTGASNWPLVMAKSLKTLMTMEAGGSGRGCAATVSRPGSAKGR